MKPLVIGDLVAKIPIIQGGMGVGISACNLAGAVALEGGIGVISAAQLGYLEEDYDENAERANLRAIGKHVRKAKEI
ncbi:MAG: nitronate monooxygenase, partial [Lachnospiraceae bacterium]|nr:nitronate monooxygenase [Lachnospiraceae bacterium]